jgi:Zn-dependent protease
MSVETVLKYGARLMVIFMVIPLHEFAHAWSANKMGDPTPKYQNRLNLNPFRHIDPIGGLMIFLCGFGWGRPVQVNPNNFKKPRKGMALSAAAGPIANLIAAYLGMVLYKMLFYAFLKNQTEGLFWVTLLFEYFVTINIGLAVFNLIPIPPLDGSSILSYFTSYKVDRKIQQYCFYILIGFVVLVFSGLLDGPLGWIDDKVFWLMDKLTFWVDPIMKTIFKI